MNERGSVTLWLLGMAVCVLFLGGLSLDLWRVYEARRELAGLADGAAVAGATQLDEAAWRYERRLALEARAAHARSLAYLHGRVPAGTRTDVRVRQDAVSVRLSRSLRLTLLGVLAPEDTVLVSAGSTVRPDRRD